MDLIAPAIAVAKTVSTGAYPGGELVTGTNGTPVTYWIVARNSGDVVLTNVTLNDALIGYTTNLGTLAAGQSVTVGVARTITADLTNTVTASGINPLGLTNTASDTAAVDMVRPQVLVTKTLLSPLGRPALAGEPLVFAMTITNAGDLYLGTVPVTDTFNSTLLTFSNAVPGPNSVADNVLTWNDVGPLQVGGSTVITARFTAAKSGIGTNTVVTTPTTTNGIPVPPATSKEPHSAVSPAMGLSKTLVSPTNAPPFVGDTVTFTIAVTNRGDVKLDTVRLDDTFDTNFLAFVSAVPGVTTLAGNLLTWTNVGPLAVGGSRIVTSQFTAVKSTMSELTTNWVTGSAFLSNGVPVGTQTTQATVQVVAYGAIGQYVWVDLNGDGLTNEDLSALGLNGVAIRLYRVQGAATNLVGSTVTTNQVVGTTTNMGYYAFTNLVYGNYLVVIGGGVPAGLTVKTTAMQYSVVVAADTTYLYANFGFMYPPTPVTLKSFSAAYDGSEVLVKWETGVERDNLGFNVYRSDTVAGARVRVNADLIPGLGTSQGQQYELRDPVPAAGQTYYYWLEDVSTRLATDLHGPVAALWQDAPAVAGSLGSFRVSTGGLYRIAWETLAASPVPAQTLDPSQLQIHVNGKEVAAYVSAVGATLNGGDYVLFYAPEAGVEQSCDIGLGTNASRMTLVFARPSRAPGDVSAAMADAGQTLFFDASTNYVRYILGDFTQTPVWVLDITDPTQSKLMYGYSYVRATNGLSAVYLSYPAPDSEPARCTAVGDQAVMEVPAIRWKQ